VVGLLSVKVVDLRFEVPGVAPLSAFIMIAATFGGAWLRRPGAFSNGGDLLYLISYAVLVSIRGVWWDYYLLNPFLVLLATPNGRAEARETSWYLAGGMVALGAIYAVWFVGYIRTTEQKMVSYELLLRSRRIFVDSASKAPFGFLGWKLFNYTTKLDRPHPMLADFLKFVKSGSTDWLEGVLVVREVVSELQPLRVRQKLVHHIAKLVRPMEHDRCSWRAGDPDNGDLVRLVLPRRLDVDARWTGVLAEIRPNLLCRPREDDVDRWPANSERSNLPRPADRLDDLRDQLRRLPLPSIARMEAGSDRLD